jgi:hypothetical protein
MVETMNTDGTSTGIHGEVAAKARAAAARARAISPPDEKTALALAGGGALMMCLSWQLRSRSLGAVGAIAALAGGGLYARGRTVRDQQSTSATPLVAVDDIDPSDEPAVAADLSTDGASVTDS